MAAPNPERELARLKSTVASGLPRVVVVAGASGFFRGEAFELLLEQVPPRADLRRVDGSQDSDGRELLDLRGGSLFGSGTWLAVRRGDAWLKSHGEALLAALDKVAEGCGLVLEVTKIDKRTRVARALVGAGQIFEFRDLYAEPYDRTRSPLEAEIVGWLVGRARDLGMRLQPAAAYLVVASVGAQPAELIAELHRLRTVLPAGDLLGAEDLRGHTTCSFESTPFEFAEAVLAFDRRRAMRSLQAMFARGIRQRDGGKTDAGGVFPFVVSWLHQSLCAVREGRVLLDGGVSPGEVAARAGVRVFVERFSAQVRDNPEPRLRRGIHLLSESQRELRATGEDPELLLERFLARYFREGAA